jgi:hypothetical protein
MHMNFIKTLAVAACVCAGATSVRAQSALGGTTASTPQSMPPRCALVSGDARNIGCTLWSELLPVTPPTVDGKCIVLNVHPTKTISGTIDFFEYFDFPSHHILPIWSVAFTGLLPGHGTSAPAPMPVLIAQNQGHSTTLYCRITLAPASPQDHADARQVRTAMSVVDFAGNLVSSLPLQ